MATAAATDDADTGEDDAIVFCIVVVVNNDDNRVPGVPPLAATGWDGAAGGRRFDGDRWTVAGSLATGSLRPREKRRSGGTEARPCDMVAIWRLLGGGLLGCVQRCSGASGGGGTSGTNNSTTNLTAGGKQKAASTKDR